MQVVRESLRNNIDILRAIVDMNANHMVIVFQTLCQLVCALHRTLTGLFLFPFLVLGSRALGQLFDCLYGFIIHRSAILQFISDVDGAVGAATDLFMRIVAELTTRQID